MHEISVAQSILEIALRHAEQAKATQITAIYLVIGDLSSFVNESIQLYWDMISKETIAVGATLHFTRIPGRMICHGCQHEFEIGDSELICPQCGSVQVMVIDGEQFFVEAIDVETV